MSVNQGSSQRRSGGRGALFALALVTVLTYAPGLRAPFTFDDRFLVQRSPVVLGSVPIAEAFQRGY